MEPDIYRLQSPDLASQPQTSDYYQPQSSLSRTGLRREQYVPPGTSGSHPYSSPFTGTHTTGHAPTDRTTGGAYLGANLQTGSGLISPPRQISRSQSDDDRRDSDRAHRRSSHSSGKSKHKSKSPRSWEPTFAPVVVQWSCSCADFIEEECSRASAKDTRRD